MKIVQINVVYGVGSTGKLVRAVHRALLSEDQSSVVLYGRGADADDPGVRRTGSELYAKRNAALARASGILYGGCSRTTQNVIRFLQAEKPDVVHLHCINGNFINIYSLMTALRDMDTHVVLTLHAEFMYTGGCSHAFDCDRWLSRPGCGACPLWRTHSDSWFFDRTACMWQKMNAAMSGFGDRLTVVSVSPWLQQRAQRSPILSRYSHRTILNGVDTTVFHPSDAPDEITALRKKGFRHIVLHVTAAFSPEPDHPKGGSFVLEMAARRKDTAFLIAGNCLKPFPGPENVFVLGPVSDQPQLAALYSGADATLITSRRETFSMPLAESLCCGTKVVGFRAGGPESIAIPQATSFCDYGNTDALENALARCLDQKTDPAEISSAAARSYCQNRMIREYLDLYQQICDSRFLSGKGKE